jgi:ABC-type nitrate/sulfonate/bicarbonate transport system permease component
MKIKKESYYSLLSIIALIVVSEVVIRIFFKNSRYIIPPSEVFLAYKDAMKENLIINLVATIIRTLIGFTISSIIGIVFGVILGRIKWLRLFIQPFIDLFRPLPSSAIIPAAMMLIGLSESTYIFIIVFGGTWPILINTISGVKDVDPSARAAINQLGLKTRQLLIKFILPEAAPEIFSGLKISLSICLILAVTAEIIMGYTSGIGQFLNNVEAGGNYKLMYFSIIVIALVGFILNSVFVVIENNHKWLKYKYED